MQFAEISELLGLRCLKTIQTMEDDDSGNYDWESGYGIYAEELDHEPERVEQPYLDSMYRARLGFPEPFYQPVDVQVGNKRLSLQFKPMNCKLSG